MSAARIFVGGRVLRLLDEASTLHPQALAIAARDGRILALGEESDLRGAAPQAEIVDLAGRLVTPGLIDCHTHIVYGGHRADEAERRLGGESYEAIARSGGGILRTVADTAALDETQLLRSALPRIDALLAEGVTTLEIKSGYGLTLASELRLLRAARAVATRRPVSVSTTYLAAHALPPDLPGGADAFIERLCTQDLPAVAASGLADALDAYCERIAFSADRLARLFDCARALGLPIKLHADQFSDAKGAALAARYGALSADHLEYADDAGIAALGGAGTVAVLLPGAYYFLRERKSPSVQALRAARVPMAVATDCNPGTSPLTSLLAAMNLAAVLFGLTTAECLAGVTREAARALGLGDRGTLEPGKWCDLAVWEVDSPAELVLALGARPLHQRIWRAQIA